MNTIPTELGKYQIKKVIGQGAMGIVYQGYDAIIDRMVAIKVLHPHHCQGEHGTELSKRFRREAQAAARCLHNNIVAVFDYGTYLDQDFIVMEYIEGEELSHFLNAKNQLSLDETIFITISVLRALSAAHKHNIVHRDIKPANIILLNDGEVKVADFGVALLDQSDLTLVGNMVGTPNYMSPEGLRGETVTSQADIYSTGMVLLEMLTGARLTPQQLYTLPINDFIDQTFEKHLSIDASIIHIVRKALAANTSERYSSAADFIKALEDLSSIEQNVNATVIAKKAIQVKAKELIKLPAQTLADLESNLTGYLGPIASILIKKTSSNSTSAKAFMHSLALHISDESARSEFIQQASKTLEQEIFKESLTQISASAAKSPANEPVTAQPPAQQLDRQSSPLTTPTDLQQKVVIDEDKLALLIQALAYYLGPLARHHVKRAHNNSDDYQALCLQLAALIPDANDRNSFLAKVSST
ncbi:serine/threonine-protein kinase [Gammaproteobacteria bacterium AS21]